MSTLSQFMGGGSLPVGAIVQSNHDLSGNSKWLPMRGQTLSRTAWPELAALYPANIGVMTSTSRTLAETPAVSIIASDATYAVCPGASATPAKIQYSTNGVSWSTTTVGSSGSQVTAICKSNTRWVLAVDGAGTFVAATPAGPFTATTGGALGLYKNCLVYSPSLGLTVAVPGTGTTTLHTLADGATAWVARTSPVTIPAPNLNSNPGGCWTGSRFIFPLINSGGTYLATIQSTDGVTWTSLYLPVGAASPRGIASDGAGTVVIGFQGFLLVSQDHGATWVKVTLPRELGTDVQSVRYTNGRFVLAGLIGLPLDIAGCVIGMSTTGLTWHAEPIGLRGISSTIVSDIAFLGSTYFSASSNDIYALTATEDATKFRVPADTKYTATPFYDVPAPSWIRAAT